MADATNKTPKTSCDERKLSLREIRKTLYHCRDFEITNLWQRSVFLFAFLLLCFTGYGCWFSGMIKDFSPNSTAFILKNVVACFLAIIGIVLSLIWIMMAKGSKAWYEVYEQAITKLEEDDLDIPVEFVMGNAYNEIVKKREPELFDESIISVKGGKYSPSKLNIRLGHLLFGVWIIIAAFHCLMFIIPVIPVLNLMQRLDLLLFFIFFVLILIVVFSAVLNKWAKSNLLCNKKG